MAKKPPKKKASSTEGPDFGAFTIGHPDEQALFAQLWELAAKNKQFPGTAHIRMAASHRETGLPVGVKNYHLDLNRHLLVAVEEHDGRVTARKTVELNQTPTAPDTRPPALDPGPAEASFQREAFTAADLDIEEELRDWAMNAIDEMLPGLAAVPACVGIFRPRQQDAFAPAQPLFPANAARMGTTLARLRQRPGVVRAMAEGWLDTGEPAGLAFVLEPLADEGWWLATRPFVRRAGPIGEWTGPWHAVEGTGPAQLPMALRSLRWPLAAALPYETGEPKVVESQENEVACGDLPPDQKLPATAEEYAALAAFPFERDVIANKGVHSPRVVVFRGRSWERWNLDGHLPTDLDDMVRNICRHGPQPDAVVLVQFGVVPVDGAVLTKCLLSMAEHADARFTRAMEIRADSTGQVSSVRYLNASWVDDDRWIGVAPITELTRIERKGEPVS